jgi:hypothetical protein
MKNMRSIKFLLPGYIITGLLLSFSAFGQTQTFSDSNVEYTFEIPEPAWKVVEKPSAANPNVEFVYNDRMEGYFEIRKLNMDRDELISDVIAREQEQRLQFKPGFVAGKEENFQGLLKGKVYNWEYVQAGRNMSGRYYFLRSGDTTVYVLRFTGLRDKLRSIRNQTDSIARTFKIKAATEKSN